MSLAAYHRQKAAVKMRRLSAFERSRSHQHMSGVNGTVIPSNSASVTQSQTHPHHTPAQSMTHMLELDGANAKEYFTGERFQHARDGNGHWLSRHRNDSHDGFDWRLDSKMRTVCAALCYCLNIGTDPPGVDRPTPCAMMECWIDPNALQPPVKSLELIGHTLQSQYSRWQPKAKYELLLDPTSGAVKRMCTGLRRTAKNERILFHYNGHGVPKPTINGELWVFDKSYTLYVPLSIYDLLTWLGGPTILVLDCSAAGIVQDSFISFIREKVDEHRALQLTDPDKASQMADYSESILLGACAANQSLPLTPASLPMDLFTSCLTTPLKIALKFFAANSVFAGGILGGLGSFESFTRDSMTVGEELLDKIPGKINDRKTPLGELNWIYTAITDTIAWNILPQHLFQKLFRQDLLLASLLRNFLLATRILSHHGCTTVSYPPLPNVNLIAKHPLWQSWDLCCEQYLLALDKWLHYPPAARVEGSPHAIKFPREHINFFTEHLLAFEIWLEVGSESMGPPLQLPIVLQVLLSQSHRRRALILLARFLGKGKWAVKQALAVGIFPYVLKLLQSPDLPLREVLVFIWSKILAVDRSCQADIIREHHEAYFLNHLAAKATTGPAAVTDRQRVMSGFVLAALCDGEYTPGQKACLRLGTLGVAVSLLESESPSLRKWMCLLLGKLWDGFEEARALAASQGVPEKLCAVIADPVPEVRAAALYALGTFMSSNRLPLSHIEPSTPIPHDDPSSPSSNASTAPTSPIPPTRERLIQELMLAKNFSQLVVDASPLVREELVLALAQLVESQSDEFVALAQERIGEDGGSTSLTSSAPHSSSSSANVSAGGSMSVPPSPIHQSLSPANFAFPVPLPSSSLGASASTSYVPAAHTLAGAAATSPALRGQPPVLALGRSVSEHPPIAAATQAGLALSLSPTIMSASSAAASHKNSVTPLSPLHLQTWSTTTSNAVTRANSACLSGSSNASHMSGPSSSMSISLSSPPSSNRPSIQRNPSQSFAPSGSPESAQHNQRLLLWRVIRTLSHDPFPTVATAALSLRKILLQRAAALTHSSQSPFTILASMHSVHGSPLIQSSIGLLNTVPEQSLDNYSFLDTPQSNAGSGVRGSYDSMAYPSTPNAANLANNSGSHLRGKSDGSLTLTAPYDAIQTRPRSRPVSEFEHPPQSTPHHLSTSSAQLPTPAPATLQASPSILSALSSGGSSMSVGSSIRASSPIMNTRTSASASPAASPRQGAQPQPRRTVITGHRLTFDDMPPTPSHAPNQLPITLPPSSIYERSAEHFLAPVGAAATTEGQDADAMLENLLSSSWRHKRNMDLLHSTSQIRHDCYDVQDRGAFDQIATLATGFEQVSSLLFHPFENLLVVSEKRQIAVWDMNEFERINQFSNQNPRGSKISGVAWVNEYHQSLLLAGSDDGVVRLWKNVHLSNQPPEIVSAWLAVRSMPRGSGVGLVLDWQQSTGHLLAAGPVDSIRVWDVEREICVLDLPVDSDSYVSSICSQSEGGVVYAGCGDGVVRMFDLRADNHQIHTVTKHPGSVVNVHMQRWGPEYDGDLVSGGIGGDIHICDTRVLGGPSNTVTASVVTVAGFEKPLPLDALAIHDHAPIFAAGSRKQVVRIADFKSERAATNNNTVSTLKFFKGFMGRRLDPITTLAFHPHKLVLGVGAYGPDVPIFVAQPAAVH